MQADYIQDIVKRFQDLPYECILFDGAWGIGKTYAIDEALRGQENVCKISMFGLQNSQQIYHEVLFQSTLKHSKAGKAGEFASDVLAGISSIWESAAQARDVLQKVTREKELFFLLSNAFKSLHIIVIDDLERINDDIKLEEVLGIVEELKKCNYVKVILVANAKEIQGSNKTIFNKYNEKVIDRVYYITERPAKINWGNLGIHAGFVQEFLLTHKVKNLRTLQKAQNFFDDVKLYCNDIHDDKFIDEIRLMCFAIVVESTDNLYFQELSESEIEKKGASYVALKNGLEQRIANYLRGIKSRRNLLVMLMNYYKDIYAITNEDMLIEYDMFIKTGEKPNFYKTDTELKRILPALYKEIENTNKLSELNKYMDEYAFWTDIIGEDNTAILEIYKEKLQTLLRDAVMNGQETILGYNYDLWHTSSEKVKQIYTEIRNNVRRLMIKEYVDYLSGTTKGVKAFEYSYKLREYYNNTFYRDLIQEMVKSLYDRKSFPVDDIDVKQYDTCYNIMYVLYHTDAEKFLDYCDKLSKNCDNMSAHRIKVIVERITGRY